MLLYLTGATGFLGQHLREALKAHGHIAVWNSHTEVNLLSQDETCSAIFQVQPDAVIHCAAKCGGIGANMNSPATFWRENLLMGMNVLEASARAGVAKLVMIGTTCSYPKYCLPPFREVDLFCGYPEDTNAPYGIAKRSLIVGADAYRREFGLHTVTVIPTNLYGPGDNFDPKTSHVIPALIRKFASADDQPVKLWGSGKPTRDFLYVKDAAEGIVAALERYDAPEPINLGSGHEVSIADLAGMVRDACGSRSVIEWDTAMPDGQPRRALDSSRAFHALKWVAKTSLEDGLRETVDWWGGKR